MGFMISFLHFCVLWIVLVLSGCSHLPKSQTSQPIKSAPQAAFSDYDPNHITIAVVGMNDFHGMLLPREKKLPDGRVVKSGGASTLAAMIKILRKEMNGRVLVVDAGDEWQGTLESNRSKGATVVDFFNQLGVQVAAIGNHEFDFTVDSMLKQIKKAKYPYVASNIFEKTTQKRPHWPNVYPSRLIEVEGISFGVIGVSTVFTPKATRYDYVKDLNFLDPTPWVKLESKKLRKNGASAVLVTEHAGIECADKGNLRDWTLHDETQKQSECDRESETYKLAMEVGSTSDSRLDGIVAGHVHQVVHHWINGIPVVEGEAFNQHFNIIYYTFDRKTKKLISNLTRIEGLVPICAEVFEGTSFCDVRRLSSAFPANVSPKLVPAVFHGEVVKPDEAIEQWMTPIVAETNQYKKKIIGVSELPLTHDRYREAPFGNLVADVLLKEAKTDFSLINGGGIRASIDAGPITFDALFSALPFDNHLNVLRLSGKEVKILYRIAHSGAKEFYGFAGLKINLIRFDEAAHGDLNMDGKEESWEADRILSITTADGKPIDDTKTYTVATFDYLVDSDQIFNWFMKKLKRNQIIEGNLALCRDLVLKHLSKEKVINTKERPLVDPKNPRVVFSTNKSI